MYNQKLVASLKANGRILREIKDNVLLPFGCEYSLLLKNLNTVRAVVNVFIDGEDQCPGGLVLAAGQEIDLERSIKNNNLNEGNRFKFIERTGAVEAGPRGIKLEDGIIRIEFQFEKYVAPSQTLWGSTWTDQWNNKYPPGVRSPSTDKFWCQASGSTSTNVGGVMRSVDHSKGEYVKSMASASIAQYAADNNIQCSAQSAHDGMATMDSYSPPKNDIGITVPGSKSEQKFYTATIGALDPEKHSIVLKLLGELSDGAKILSPLTVHYKPKCVTCGKQNKATAHFCSECGTALEIFA